MPQTTVLRFVLALALSLAVRLGVGPEAADAARQGSASAGNSAYSGVASTTTLALAQGEVVDGAVEVVPGR